MMAYLQHNIMIETTFYIMILQHNIMIETTFYIMISLGLGHTELRRCTIGDIVDF